MTLCVSKYRIGVLVAIVFSSFLIFSCRKDDNGPSGPALQQHTVTIGALLSLTGPGSTLGLSTLAALEIAAADVNTYLDSIQAGVHFGLITRDTKMDSAAALTYLDWLSAAGTQVVIGPQSSAELAAVRPYAETAGLLVISHSASAAALALPDDNIYRFCPDDRTEGKSIAALLHADSITAIILLTRNDLGSFSVMQSMLTSWTGAASRAIIYPVTASLPSDFSSAINDAQTTLAALIPQYGAGHVALVCCGFEEQAAVLRAAAAAPLLMTSKWYGGSGAAQSNIFVSDTSAGSIAARVEFSCPSPALAPAASFIWSPLNARISSLIGYAPDTRALAAYDAFWVAALAYLTAHGTEDIISLKAAFQTMADQHQGATGWTRLNQNGDRTAGDIDFWTVRKNGTAFSWTKSASYNIVLDKIVR